MKRYIAMFISILMLGCATVPTEETPRSVPKIETIEPVSIEIEYETYRMKTNFNLVQRKQDDHDMCYIVVRITNLPGKRNAWRISGYEVGDFIVLYGRDAETLSSLPCSHNDVESVYKWFLGKAKMFIHDKKGWPTERFRIIDSKTFTLTTVIVSIHNTKPNYLGDVMKYTKPKAKEYEF